MPRTSTMCSSVGTTPGFLNWARNDPTDSAPTMRPLPLTRASVMKAGCGGTMPASSFPCLLEPSYAARR